MKDIDSHNRINDILLGPLERPLLQWFSQRMPAWVTPDILTFIGILGAVMIFLSYVATNLNPIFLWFASLGFIINWFGDSLDGTLARHRNIQRPVYGFFVDHIVDAISQVLIILGLGLSPFIRFDIASLVLVGYLLMSILIYLTTCVSGVFKISYGRFGPTELRVIVIFINSLMFFIGNPVLQLPFGSVRVFDLFAASVAVILGLVFIGSAIRQMRTLAVVDPSP